MTGNFDRNQDGVDDSTYIFRVSGANEVKASDKIGIAGTMTINGIDIEYYGTDTVEQVIRRINDSDANVNAFISQKGKLTIKADYNRDESAPDFVIKDISDDGLFLTGYAGILAESGEDGSFRWDEVGQADRFRGDAVYAVAPKVHPSAYMQVESKILADDAYIATADGVDTDGDGIKDVSNGIGDSSIAIKIASIKHEKVMVGMSQTFTEYFEGVIADIGSRASAAEKGFKSSELLVQNLENIRKSVSGVNLDEEFANMIKYQHGYNATAKIVSEMDKMIETLIFRLG